MMLRLVSLCLGALMAAAVPVWADQEEPPMPGSSVWIPWTDFKGILDKIGGPDGPTPPKPPYAAVLSGADYVAEAGAESVDVTVRGDIVVLETAGWATVPIFRRAVPLLDVTVDGKPGALARDDSGGLSAVVQGAGAHTITLRLSVPLSAERGPEHFTLPVLLAPVHRAEIRVAHADMQVTFDPGGPVPSKTQAGGTVAVGSFSDASEIRVSWVRKASKTEREEARVAAEVRTLLTVGEGLAVYTSIVDFDIRHKPTSVFRFWLPESVSVADVTSEGLVDWNVTAGDGGDCSTCVWRSRRSAISGFT
ncbi:MAG: hypothetical protein M5R36_24305 [Deltaproteobacteria bacterium]|nr:hypothetical protein [Deltaproteobacteria bacterium]